MRRIIIEIDTNHEVDNDSIAEMALNHLRHLRDQVKLLPEEAYRQHPLDAGLASINIELEAKK